MRLRFPKSARLTRASEFRRVKDEGKACHGRLIVLSVLNTSSPDAARIGLITSRRVGNAVARNKVRRRLRELVRAARPHLRSGSWLVIIARRDAAAASFSALQEEWGRLSKRAAVLISPLCS